ncbi:MAG: GNAT family N-acetyltransferase [Bacteroidia bacterium]|nr:GNAT family N-acetyltransferase [Bacteroidia bacterium]
MDPISLSRVRIRPLSPDDFDAFLAYRSDPEVARLQGYDPFTPERAEVFLQFAQKPAWDLPGEWMQLGVELAETGQLIGDIGLKPESFDTRILELGFSFARAWQGQGLAGEAIAGLIGYAFTRQSVHRIYAYTDVRNTRAARLLQRLHFRHEGTTLQSFYGKGAWRDEYLFAQLASEWAGRHHQP